MTTKQDLHTLIDAIPDDRTEDAARLLAPLVDGEYALRSAPIGQEPLTDDDWAAIAESRAELAAGQGIRQEELEREFGL